jgi:hypothetical protein
MIVEPTGIVLVDACTIQTEKCVARHPAPITVVWTLPGRVQVNVCRPCLEEQVRLGEWEIRGAKIERRADVAVYSPDNRLQLVVEVKKTPRTQANLKEWATKVRRNLMAHSGIPNSAYFLLAVFPDSLFLWKNSDPFDLEKAPDYEERVPDTLKAYFDELPSSPDNASEDHLVMVTTSWLKDLAKSARSKDPSFQWVYDSGLYDAIKNGSVVMQAAIAA